MVCIGIAQICTLARIHKNIVRFSVIYNDIQPGNYLNAQYKLVSNYEKSIKIEYYKEIQNHIYKYFMYIKIIILIYEKVSYTEYKFFY